MTSNFHLFYWVNLCCILHSYCWDRQQTGNTKEHFFFFFFFRHRAAWGVSVITGGPALPQKCSQNIKHFKSAKRRHLPALTVSQMNSKHCWVWFIKLSPRAEKSDNSTECKKRAPDKAKLDIVSVNTFLSVQLKDFTSTNPTNVRDIRLNFISILICN